MNPVKSCKVQVSFGGPPVAQAEAPEDAEASGRCEGRHKARGALTLRAGQLGPDSGFPPKGDGRPQGAVSQERCYLVVSLARGLSSHALSTSSLTKDPGSS